MTVRLDDLRIDFGATGKGTAPTSGKNWLVDGAEQAKDEARVVIGPPLDPDDALRAHHERMLFVAATRGVPTVVYFLSHSDGGVYRVELTKLDGGPGWPESAPG